MNPFLRYLADKNSAHRQTDRHTPMITIPCGLRRAGKHIALLFSWESLLEAHMYTVKVIYRTRIVGRRQVTNQFTNKNMLSHSKSFEVIGNYSDD